MNNTLPYAKPEIWGGMECTINRTKDGYRDQLDEIGHYDRRNDLEQLCSLGFSKFRYPILWERHSPVEEKSAEWDWTGSQLDILRKHNIDVIAGLVHHGSGPEHTDLADINFPTKLASYARQVATAYPWINYYTPVNEPLTTARFSGLYGIWHPHAKDDALFVRMLVNQLKAIVLSMQAIREINPAAQLVQTEDLGKTHSTPLLSYQADFENERRWLTYDFLTGKVDRRHFAWSYFTKLGIAENELQFFLDHPCPPAIAGFNYYVTSERYLDENLENFPPVTHGCNGKHTYADTEAVRNMRMQGAGSLLTEAWWRYKIPLALTECQLTCTREQQMRWFFQHWHLVKKMTGEGIPVCAITAWGLLGTTDWDSLLARNDQHYEPGVYIADTSGIRATALAPLIKNLAKGMDDFHPALDGRGWWEYPRPLAFDGYPFIRSGSRKKLLILGSDGTLGAVFCRLCQERGLNFAGLSHQELDVTDAQLVYAAIEQHRPWAIINASAFSDPDEAERKHDLCFKLNSYAPAQIASLCKKHGIQFLHFSTDMVFDGAQNTPYIETDKISPINVYGRSKADGEQAVFNHFDEALIVRSSTFFSPWNKKTFAAELIDSIRSGIPFYAPADVIVSPTYVPDLVNASLDILIDKAAGIWHITNTGQISLLDFARELASGLHKNGNCVIQRDQHDMGWAADRPAYSALKNHQGIYLPRLEKAIERFSHHVKY